jgi:hypothetical protein
MLSEKLHLPPVQFLIRTSAKFMIAHKLGLFLSDPTGVLFFPFGQAVVNFFCEMPNNYAPMAVIL